MNRLILASNSPRRRELLSLIGIPFETRPVDLDETPLPDEMPDSCVRRLAESKAMLSFKSMDRLIPSEVRLIASDTIVVDGLSILGKPIDERDAEQMLRRLRGKVHQVYTAVTVIPTKNALMATEVCITDVPIRDYTDEEMKAYIASGDPFDKAGAYAIQHRIFHPVDRMEGCYASVMGFPVCLVTRMLRQSGVTIGNNVPKKCQRMLDYSCPVYDDYLTGTKQGQPTSYQ
jgi:MAF protein